MDRARGYGEDSSRAIDELARLPPSDDLVEFFDSLGQRRFEPLGMMAHPRASQILVHHFKSSQVESDWAGKALAHPRHASAIPDLLAIALTNTDEAHVIKALIILDRIGTSEAKAALAAFANAPAREIYSYYTVEDTGESAKSVRSSKDIKPGQLHYYW